ncbi:MAG: AAA family ATPase [Dethiobacteria bacterium]
MSRVIAVANQKGGVGKTTTAVNLSASLAYLGQEVLLVDIDPQGNATSGLGVERNEIKSCIYDVLINEIPIERAIVDTKFDRLKAVPASIQLAGAEVELVLSISREIKLKEALRAVENKHSIIIIDCPPSLGLLTLNALTAAGSVIIPIQCEYYALEGLGQLMNTINLVKKHLNPNLHIEGVVLTMYDARTNLSAQVAGEVKNYFNEMVYNNIIPRNVRLSEAPSYGKPIIEYDPRSKGSEVYLGLAREVMNK